MCAQFVAALNADGLPVTLKHLRRAHTDHQHPRSRRALIRKGRKP